MIEKIPSALLVTRVGGRSVAHETRKVCFHFQAPHFLQKVAQEVGPLAGTGVAISTLLPLRESGSVTWESKFLKMKICEDPLRHDGLTLDCSVLDASGALTFGRNTPMGRLAKNAELFELVCQIKEQLKQVKTSLH